MSMATDPFAITQKEKSKGQEQFKVLQPQNGVVTGAQAKGFFLQSQLPPLVLGQIWALADTDADGKMNINEFTIACKLINLKLRGFELPKVLPPIMLSSLSSAAGTPILTPTGTDSLAGNFPSTSVAGLSTIHSQPLAVVPTQPIPIMPAVAGVVPQILPIKTNTQVPGMQGIQGVSVLPVVHPIVPSTSAISGILPGQIQIGASNPSLDAVISAPTANSTGLPAPLTPPQSNPPSRSMSMSERAPSLESPLLEWSIKGPQKLKYTQLFNTTDRSRSGFLTGVQARNILMQSKLPQATLAQIWALSDMDSDGRLGCEEFVLAMYLCDRALSGEQIPVTLSPDLIPPSFRKVKSRHGSISASRHGSISVSRNASISSQGAVDADPTVGLSHSSFEDKRKENFDKGQAELDRRRKFLMDQQRKEQEERERKEREDIDKKERLRLEAEKKQQEELERQLQHQREFEIEKEEQRKRALEAKETARKELEKQRQLDWDNQRISEMQFQKQREQEKVLKFKAQNQTYTVELSTLNEKIRELSQNICDTRAGVTNVKSVIDGMRSTRDVQMTDMSQLKAKIKEQNQKLLQLSQEKAKWDAKAKATSSAERGQEEHMNSAFANKQVIIKNVKDKIENIRGDIELKKVESNSNDIQLTELKAELNELIEKCEELYTNYDSHRTQVLEVKHNRKNETYSTAWEAGPTSTWVTDTSSQNAPPTDECTAVIVTSSPAPEGFVKYRAVYEFSARNADEITFQPGDIILVPLEQNAEPGWFAGEINGHTGWFPETYVEKMDDPVLESIDTYPDQDNCNDNNELYSEPAATATVESVEIETTEAHNGDVKYYIAAYPYESTEPGDLAFTAGEMVMVTKKEGDWWTGLIGSRTGMFPSNYVQKADVGSAITLPESHTGSLDNKGNLNGNVQPEYIDTQVQLQQELEQTDIIAQKSAITDESRTQQEELDTEVSQINTQPKDVEQSQESYSRPMSRTSSMTPGMRGKKSEIAQVLAPYEASSTEQLSLQRGQLIMIRKKTDSGWWEGELQAKGRRRQIGWFPASYVKILQGGRNSGRNTPVSGSRIEMTETILDKVIALYSYKAQNDDELSFDKDDILSVLGRDEPEWWRGELNGLSGLFPSNYVGPLVSSGKKDGT